MTAASPPAHRVRKNVEAMSNCHPMAIVVKTQSKLDLEICVLLIDNESVGFVPVF